MSCNGLMNVLLMGAYCVNCVVNVLLIFTRNFIFAFFKEFMFPNMCVFMFVICSVSFV